MSISRIVWLLFTVWMFAVALSLLGLGIFDLGPNTPSDQFVYLYCALAFLNWVAYSGSRR